jgi:hypothetical protein
VNQWYEYVLITGVLIQNGYTPDDYCIDVEGGSVLFDNNVLSNNDEPAARDTWVFEGFAFIAPGRSMIGCGGGMLGYEFDSASIDIFAPYYDDIAGLFRQYERSIQDDPGYCSAAVFTQWSCTTASQYDPYTGSYEWENGWELVGEFVLSQTQMEQEQEQ